MREPIASRMLGKVRSLLPVVLLLAVGLAAFKLFPSDLGLLTRIAIMAIFVLSLSLIVGQAGIATLGHAAYFGCGAYAAGLWALHVSSEPISGLIVGAVGAALLALITGALMLRTRGLTFLMLSIATSQLVFEIANKARWLTGGDDGLGGIRVDPLLGTFRFDLFGRTGFVYALVVLALMYLLLRVLVASPFGLTCRGIRFDRSRMSAIGCPVYSHLIVAYTISGAIAGVAGALSAQTARVVGLHSLSFELSAEALVMLIIGGSAKLVGALIGVPVFMIVHHVASTVNPYHWLLVIGVLLIVTVLFAPNGLAQLLERIPAGFRSFRRKASVAETAASERAMEGAGK